MVWLGRERTEAAEDKEVLDKRRPKGRSRKKNRGKRKRKEKVEKETKEKEECKNDFLECCRNWKKDEK